MAELPSEEIEMEELPDMSDYDYDLEYLVRRRHKGNIDITRQRLNEVKFESGFLPTRKKMPTKERVKELLTPPEPIKSALMPPRTRKDWWRFLLVHFPLINMVWSYQCGFFPGDIIAGVTVAIMHIPQGLAYALLATLPPVYGLYTSFVPPLIYSIFGTSRHISIGTFAVVELMIGNSIGKTLTAHNMTYCLDDQVAGNLSNVTDVCDEVKVEIALTIALLTGLIMLVMGVFQLGFITIFLSEPLVSGYTTAAAVHVFTSQLRHIIGIEVKVAPGLWTVPKTWIASLSQIADVNPATIVVSIVSIAILIGFRLLNKGLQRIKVPVCVYSRKDHRWCVRRYKWPMPLPSQLIIVAVGVIISVAANLEDRFSVAVVGDIPSGPPEFSLPSASFISVSTIIDSFVMAIVTFSVTISLAKVFSRRYNYPIYPNQELLAYGVMNIIGPFFSSFTAAGSLSRSLIQASSGGKTQFVSFVSSFIILIILIALGFIFEQLPRAVLAAIIWVALYGMFTQIMDLRKYYKISLWDVSIWVVVFTATVFLGVDLGLGVGIAYSLLVLVIRILLPYSSALGQASDTEIFRNISNFEMVKNVPGVLIFRFQAPLCFINSKVFRLRLEILSNLNKDGLNTEKPGFLQELITKRCLGKSGSYSPEEESGSSTEQGTGLSRTASFQQAMSHDVISRENLSDSESTRVHTVIIDCAPIGFLDVVGVKALQEVVTDFDACGVQVLFSALTRENRDMLERVGFFKSLGKEWLFPTIQDAVHHAKFGERLHPSEEEPTRLQEQSPQDESQIPNGAEQDQQTQGNSEAEPPVVAVAVEPQPAQQGLTQEVHSDSHAD